MADQPSPARYSIAVGSGKGGVGKSTIALNLAIALGATGASVGLLDADIYGPDIPVMVNLTRTRERKHWMVARNPELGKHTIPPVEAFGIKIMSAGFLFGEEQPLSWTAGLVDAFLGQLLGEVEWGDLRYLVVDLPPGTADLQQALVRRIPLSGALVVVTPQDVAHLDARKLVEMYRRAGVRVLGGVENMSGFACPHCGERIVVFPRASEARSIWSAGIERLAEIPLDPEIGVTAEAGRPVFSVPGSATATLFQNLAREVVRILLD